MFAWFHTGHTASCYPDHFTFILTNSVAKPIPEDDFIASFKGCNFIKKE